MNILEKINQRQRQILVHSIIYYTYNDNIISDKKWTQYAQELVKLQKKYPEETKQSVFYTMFKGFEGSSGFDLDLTNEWADRKARQLIGWRKA